MDAPNFRSHGLKLVILDLLRTPNHGYGIMASLEETYKIKISTGTVYPILASLRRSGLIKVAEEGRRKRKTYVITDKGEAYLREHEAELEDLKRKLDTFRLFMDLNGDELKEALKEFFRRAGDLDDSQKEELRKLLSECARRMKLILLGGD